jgi:AraC family transcriptional regulator, transcriptional activator of pobA
MKHSEAKSELTGNGTRFPVHSLGVDSMPVRILPLDHTNPYDYKREHRHTYYEIMLIEQGGGNQLIDFKNYEARNNSCYIIFPQQVHLMNREQSTGTVIQFTEDWISSPELRTALRQYSFQAGAAVVFEQCPDFIAELNALLDLIKSRLSRGAANRPIIVNLLHSFISMILPASTSVETEDQPENKRLFMKFCQLIEAHFAEHVSVQQYAEWLGTSEKKIATVTKKCSGLSPLQLIHNRLLLEAKRILLFEDHSHKEIAYGLGFGSPATFSAFIKSKTGFSPSELTKVLAEIHK